MKNRIREQKKSHFIASALTILKEDGLEGFTARKVAEISGFNVASIYTYFKDLDHLENAASVYFTTAYAEQLNEVSKTLSTSLESYLAMWELFAYHALIYPNYFYNVFFSKTSYDDSLNLFVDYYTAFPKERQRGGNLADMLELNNTNNRECYALQKCVDAGQMFGDMIDYISRIHLMQFKCILFDIVKSNLYAPSPELYHRFLVDFCHAFLPYIHEESKHIVQGMLDFHVDASDDAYKMLYTSV